MPEVLERVYNIPLRKYVILSPRKKRAKKAITVIRNFVIKHMHCKDVKIGKFLNEKIWERGIENPPHHIKVKIEMKDNVAYVELFGIKKEEKEEKKEKEQKEVKEKEEKTKKTKEKKETKEKKKVKKKEKVEKKLKKEEKIENEESKESNK